MTSSSLPDITAMSSVVNIVGGHQTNIYPPVPETHGPVTRSFNDAPVGRLAAHFTGRGRDLDQLEEMLNRTQDGKPSCCVIHGMPGVGKSQLSLRYSVTSFGRGLYTYIFWTSATSVDKLTQGFSKVLDLVGHPDRHVQDQSIKLIAARLWLEECSVKWLFIIDNVDRSTLDFLATHFPRKNGQGNVLFTTRTVQIAEALANMTQSHHSTLKLQTLDLRDTTRLLFDDAGICSEVVTPFMLGHAEELVQCVGYLPLAIVQAASLMKETQMTLETMLNLYKSEERIEAIRWESDLSFYEERSVAATFSRQFEKLNEESGDLSNLLKLLSFFDPETIPVRMIIDGAKEWLRVQNELPTFKDSLSPVSSQFHSLTILITSPIKFQTALQKLQSLSLVERRSDGRNSSLWMHDLIEFMMQDAARKGESYRAWLQSSVSLVCCAFRLIMNVKSPELWEDCEKFISHLRSLDEKWGDERGMNRELSQANVRIARYMEYRGRYDEAVALLRRALSGYEKDLGEDHPDTLLSMDRLGCVYWRQGRYDDAVILHQRALAGREKNLGADHLDTLTSVTDLAHVYKSQGRYDEAEVLYQRALAGRENFLGADHLDTLTSVNNLGHIYRSQGRYDGAVTLCRRALEGREKHLGAVHPDTLTSLNNLAHAYKSHGRYDEAETLYLRAVMGREKHLGVDHPDTLTSVNNLANVHRSRAQYDKAEILLLRALAGREKHLGPVHRDTLSSVNNLALLYELQGRYDEAEDLFRRALVGREKHLGPNHPHTLISANHLHLFISRKNGTTKLDSSFSGQ